MVLSSVQICMDSDWPQSVMHERTLKPLEEILPACSRPMMEQSGLKPPPPDQALKCPRCDSTNTKFCYYNNYSLSQPRHFCKACKRYWTRGGTLRNVPVGGGCRKNKRAKRTIDHACVQMNDASTSVNDLNINGSAPLGHSQITNSMFYGLNPTSSTTTHDGIHSLSLATRLADQRALYGSDSEFLRTFFDPRSCNLSALTGRSSLNSLNCYKSTFPGLNFDSNPSRTEALTRTVRDLDGSFFESLPTQISEVSLPVLNSTNCDHLSPFALSLQEGINANTNRYSEANQWRPIEQQKLAEVSDHVQVGLTPFAELENSNSTRNDPNLKVVTSLPSCVKVEGQDIRLNITSEWPAPSEPLFEAASDSAYWNAGVWPELNTYGSSVGSLI